MLRIYDGKSSLKFPLRERTADEMRGMACYSLLFGGTAVINEDESGVVDSFYSLAQLKESYGVTETDPQKALAAVEAEMQRRDAAAKREAELYASAMDTTQQATAELGVMTATSMESTADLGVTVAALESRIAALEAANAPKA